MESTPSSSTSSSCDGCDGQKTVHVQGASTVLVLFGGLAQKLGGIPIFEFSNFLESRFEHVQKHFYVDHEAVWYHRGIRGVSTNIPETIHHLREIVDGYDHVIFMGVSAGGYAAMLFGSFIPNVRYVITFAPQTILEKKKPCFDTQYLDLAPIVGDRVHTDPRIQYILYGDPCISTSFHAFSHCSRLSHLPQVVVNSIPNLNMRELRDDGRLETILRDVMSRLSDSTST